MLQNASGKSQQSKQLNFRTSDMNLDNSTPWRKNKARSPFDEPATQRHWDKTMEPSSQTLMHLEQQTVYSGTEST